MQDALRGVQEHTEELELLRAKQEHGTQPRPWWADGEYDDERADAANDAGACGCPLLRRAPDCGNAASFACSPHPGAGMSHLARHDHRNAYDAFTEAIRLSPLKVERRLARLACPGQS